MIAEYYSWIKAFHIIFIICWMAAIFYTPRIFVYHTKALLGSELDVVLRTMERKLINIIMTPAMVLTYILGLLLTHVYGYSSLGGWFFIKIIAVLFLTIFHFFLIFCKNKFAKGLNNYSEKFYRIINEVPSLLLVIIIISVIIKPFE